MRYQHWSLALSLTLVLIFMTGLYGQSMQEKNKEVMKTLYEQVVNQKNVEKIDELLVDGFVEHERQPDQPEGKAGVKEYFNSLHSAFPDIKFTVNDMVAADDKVWSYITITGTHKGTFMGVEATGNKIKTETVDIVRFENGKAAEHWGVTDTGKMMQQMGMMGEK